MTEDIKTSTSTSRSFRFEWTHPLIEIAILKDLQVGKGMNHTNAQAFELFHEHAPDSSFSYAKNRVRDKAEQLVALSREIARTNHLLAQQNTSENQAQFHHAVALHSEFLRKSFNQQKSLWI